MTKTHEDPSGIMKQLFDGEILEVRVLDPGYENHASQVWDVNTSCGNYIVRTCKLNNTTENEFWYGCRILFGIIPSRSESMMITNDMLRRTSLIPVPKVYDKRFIDGRIYLIVEKLEGSAVNSFLSASQNVLKELGRGIASIHKQKFAYIGQPDKTVQYPIEQFHTQLLIEIENVLERFYGDHPDFQDLWVSLKPELLALPDPEYSTLVMIDIDPTQFLGNRNHLTGLVDTEAYAIAPRELDLIGLEYILDEQSSLLVKEGYEEIAPLPDLERCRSVYRFLYRLMEVQGKVDLDTWMDHPIYF